MRFSDSDRGASRASQVRGARTPHHHARPLRGPDHSAILERIGNRILRYLADGPRTLGEITGYCLYGNVKAAIRDEAIERLLASGRVRLATVPNSAHLLGHKPPLRALALPGGPDR